MNGAGRLIGWLVTASTVIGAVSVLLMMVQIVADVVLRNLFDVAVPGTTIFVAHYHMVIVAFLPVALAERMDSHITVEVLVQLFSTQVRRWLACVMWALSAVVAAVLADTLWGEAMKAWGYGNFIIERDIPIPIWPAYFVLPLGFGLWALVLFYRLVCGLTGAPERMGGAAPLEGPVHGGEV